MSELAELKAELAALRREIELLRAERTVHHYHHPVLPPYYVPTYPIPYQVTCTGQPPMLGGFGTPTC